MLIEATVKSVDLVRVVSLVEMLNAVVFAEVEAMVDDDFLDGVLELTAEEVLGNLGSMSLRVLSLN